MKSVFKYLLLSFLISTLLSFNLAAAENSYLELQINGSEVEGETVVAEIGGVEVSQMIECSAFEWEVYSPTDSGSGRTSGRINMGTLKFVKSVDKASPLILAGLAQNQEASGTFRFFRANSNSGASEEFYTITFSQARIVSVRDWQASTFDPVGAGFPFLEEVQIQAESITVEQTINGTSHAIDLRTES